MTKQDRDKDRNGQGRNAYLCGCRLLQWAAERLYIDTESCAMRGMERTDWCYARNLLVRANIMTTQLEFLVPFAEALPLLRQYVERERFEPVLIESATSVDHSSCSRTDPRVKALPELG